MILVPKDKRTIIRCPVTHRRVYKININSTEHKTYYLRRLKDGDLIQQKNKRKELK